MNIFEILNEKYTLPKKVKLFEAFSGIGCQRMGFEQAGIDYEVVGISEIDKYALKSYEAMFGECKNFGSITDIKGKYLPEIDVFTWSFPCTDLSKAGKQMGMTKQTRSGLAFEVMRILYEAKEANTLPKVLIMENVVDLVQSKFIRQFQELQLEIEHLGYTNHTETLNAKNYGVAQNRDRVFMVSILGDYYYQFPKPIPLEKRLKDYLEKEVDKKYYLTQKQMEFINNTKFNQMGINRVNEENSIAQTLTTMQGGNREPKIFIPEKTKKGYKEAYDGDGVYLNRPHQKRGVVQEQMIQTIKTNGDDLGVVIYDDYNQSIRSDQSTIGTLTTNCGSSTERNGYKIIEKGLNVRKLTPLECWRLMGIDDDYFYKAQKAVSNSQLYKQAGNGIVVDVFAKIVEAMK